MARPLPQDIRVMGPLQPWPMEGDIVDCVVTQGEIPTDLAGGYYRNGPNMKRPTRQGAMGLLMADGMVHAMLFQDGRATYRNRWVRTPKFLLEEQHGRSLFEWEDGYDDWRGVGFGNSIPNELTGGIPHGTAMTNVCPFNGTILALGEAALPPVALDPRTLATIGVVPWGRRLVEGPTAKANPDDGAFCVHPKWDPDTGLLHGWTYSPEPPYVTMEFVEPDGTVHLVPLDVPYASAVHDIWLSEDFVVVPIQPLYIDHNRVRRGIGMLHGWNPELSISLVLISRADLSQVRTIETDLEPQYVLHTMSANRDDNLLALDAPIYERPPFPFEDRVPYGTPWIPFDTARMGRWIVDLASGAVKSELVDDRACEFPKMDERYYGKPYRNGFLLAGDDLWSLNTVIRRDVHTGQVSEYTIKADGLVSICEPQFAPRGPEAPEGDGYLITPVTYVAERRTDYLIFDTEKVDEGPVATVGLPHQVPWTPHGCWLVIDSAGEEG